LIPFTSELETIARRQCTSRTSLSLYALRLPGIRLGPECMSPSSPPFKGDTGLTTKQRCTKPFGTGYCSGSDGKNFLRCSTVCVDFCPVFIHRRNPSACETERCCCAWSLLIWYLYRRKRVRSRTMGAFSTEVRKNRPCSRIRMRIARSVYPSCLAAGMSWDPWEA
jgi:hypothetical protein